MFLKDEKKLIEVLEGREKRHVNIGNSRHINSGSCNFNRAVIRISLNFRHLDKQNLYGLVLCGGKSSRMGEDKCFLNYHGKAQCYYMYEMLEQFCDDVFISCNNQQLPLIEGKYHTFEDNKLFENRGPATGVMTAFSKYPDKNFLVAGCDYPLLSEEEIDHFLSKIPAGASSAAFFAEESYQPVLAWYSSETGARLLNSSLSLKQLLESENAYRHSPLNELSVKSVDTREERYSALKSTNLNH